MDCKQAVSLMHNLLDDDLERSCALDLKEHMLACPACRERFRQLEETEQLLYGFNHRLQPTTDELTERIMSVIPKPKKQSAMFKWVRRHPAITVAAVFVLVMMTSALSMWNADKQLLVKGQQLDGVVIQDNKVIVPNGKVVKGDLTIHNGLAEVYGEVEGNVTVVDGKVYQASTAHITGSVQQIDEAMSWIWYQISSLFPGNATAP
ncbi:polymer-forming cytoskeletal protein [Paenibacillus sp. ACRRX]|uniref:polymer-forming cytoskeletal protein n=1 Tax=Paenibacillus TaxID=44249 RepID=UPI0004113F56|nr:MULTISPECIES: polymer-forming cytoskeletal protein [Paenibacillus]MCG7410813.1 polymer-forming cytoskeletal protein [Paenibacillus sp. ACRRX]MDK8181698.1 polymer-forming cytoskeletal protein [Paenibacillus sp. UMB4589-SE434]